MEFKGNKHFNKLMSFLNNFFEYCTIEQRTKIDSFLEKEDFPLNLNFHFIYDNKYIDKKVNYFLTIKCSIVNDELILNYNETYYDILIKIINLNDNNLDLKTVNIYKKKSDKSINNSEVKAVLNNHVNKED